MRHSIKSTMFVGAFLFGLSMSFTSCEDILGEWDKPAPVNVIVTPDDNGGGTTTSNTYLVWNGVDALEAQTIPATAIDAETGITSTTIASGTYIVKKDISLTGDYQFTGDVDLILSDNTTLTITGSLNADTWGTHKLKIYAQSEGDDKGKLVINTSTVEGISITCGDIEIHGGDIKVSSTVNSGIGGTMGLETKYDLNIYGGKVDAFGTMHGIRAYGKLNIYGGTVKGTGGTDGTEHGGHGLTGTINIFDGEVTAIGGDGTGAGFDGGHAIDGTLTVDGGTLIATGGIGDSGKGGAGIHGGATFNGGTITAVATKFPAIYANSNITVNTGITSLKMTNTKAPYPAITYYWLFRENGTETFTFGTTNVTDDWTGGATYIVDGGEIANYQSSGFKINRSGTSLVLTPVAP